MDQRGQPCAEAQFEGVEPVRLWRAYSRRACAVGRIAAAVERGETGVKDDWARIALAEGLLAHEIAKQIEVRSGVKPAWLKKEK